MKNCLSSFKFIPVRFLPLLVCISTKNKTKLKKMLNLKHRLNKVEHNFANIQTAYGFLWTLVSNLNAEQTKMNMETVIILIWRVVVKEEIIWKILIHHEITDDITEQIVSVIIQVCKELKLWIHPNLRRPSFSFTYSFKFNYFCIVDIWTLKRNFV